MASATNYFHAIESQDFVRRIGRIRQFAGLVMESDGPDVFLGECCQIHDGDSVTSAEVVGIREGRVLLMPHSDTYGMRLGSEVIATGRPVEVPVGDALIGRVINAFGEPLDGGPPIAAEARYPLFAQPRNPVDRPRIQEPLETGVAAIDTLKVVGRGQRVGIFSGSGVGKSILVGMIARHTDADISVIGLIGERGREVLEFVEEVLGDEGLARSVVVVATPDQPALVRSHAALAATAISEYFRDQGKHVMLAMDSITRFAMARREIGLAVGEPPTARGYTPSVFSLLPRLLERGGPDKSGGTITAFYSVLVEGDDMNDPVADSIRAILDGHIVLSREIANRGHYPAIDLLQSNSRLIHVLCDKSQRAVVTEAIDILSTYETHRDMVEIGAYRSGSNPKLDAAIRLVPLLRSFFNQDPDESRSRTKSFAEISSLIRNPGGSNE
ncbi:FliI/YscN family ATPase [Myxococcota bacterium]|nr:FliI/YscN family ATPase [Myxococcota bacterium]